MSAARKGAGVNPAGPVRITGVLPSGPWDLRVPDDSRAST